MSPSNRDDDIETSKVLDTVISAASQNPNVDSKLLATLAKPLQIASRGVTLAGEALEKFKSIIAPFAGSIGTAVGTATSVVSMGVASAAPKAGEMIGKAAGQYLGKESGAQSGAAIGKSVGTAVGKVVNFVTPMVSEGTANITADLLKQKEGVPANALVDVVAKSLKQQPNADPAFINKASSAIFKELKGINITGNDLKTVVGLGSKKPGPGAEALDVVPHSFTPHASSKQERKPAPAPSPVPESHKEPTVPKPRKS